MLSVKKILCALTLLAALTAAGCGEAPRMKDGFYTAEMSGYSHGWKEYLCILVENDTIVYAEFNAKDPSGYIKAWDNLYMENMLSGTGTYPNEYTRYYVSELIEKQDSGVDTLTGATSSAMNFNRLAAAAISQSEKGDPEIAVVEQDENGKE